MKKKGSELFKTRWLEWAFNFVDKKLNKLSGEERHRVNFQAYFFCSPDFRFQGEDRFFDTLPPERVTKMENEINVGMLQKKLRPAVKFLRRFGSRADGKHSPIYSFAHDLPDVCLSLYVDQESFDLHIVHEPAHPDYLSYAILNLVSLLDSPHILDSIIKCKGCRSYFIDLTKKKRIYCTNLCASRYYAQIKREDLKEKHPRKYKAYLKKQRELMGLRRKKGGGDSSQMG